MVGDETPLDAVPGFPARHAAALKRIWITTAEQLVSLSATPDGLESMAQMLGVDSAEAKRLVQITEAALPAEEAERLRQPVDTTQFPLGALPPEKKHKE